MSAAELIEQAFLRLSSRQQFDSRRDQVQLSLLLSDLIEHRSTGVFEAPTGLENRWRSSFRHFANAIANDKRTVVATYTNVLADQYWQKDLPIALSLFDEHVETAILMGASDTFACSALMKRCQMRLTISGVEHNREQSRSFGS